jgi:hypothetical protein
MIGSSEIYHDPGATKTMGGPAVQSTGSACIPLIVGWGKAIAVPINSLGIMGTLRFAHPAFDFTTHGPESGPGADVGPDDRRVPWRLTVQ